MFELITLPNTYYQATEKLYTANDHQALFAVTPTNGTQPGGHQTNGVPLAAPPPPQAQFAPPPPHHQQPPPPPPPQATSNGSINSAAILAAAAQALAQAQTNSIIAAAAQQHSSQSSSPGTNGTPVVNGAPPTNGMHVITQGPPPSGPQGALGSSSHNSIHDSSQSHSSANTSPSNSIHQHVASAGAQTMPSNFFLGANPPAAGCFSIPTGVPGTEPSNAGKCQPNDSVRNAITAYSTLELFNKCFC